MSALEKLHWYRNRLAAMSLPEIGHRVHERLRRKADARNTAKLAPPPRDLGELPRLPGLRDGLTGWQVPAALLAEWEEAVAHLQSGQFLLLGQQWPVSDPAHKWHLDPVTGKHWPADRYCFDIDFRHTDAYGDIKYVWELNRLQFLQPVAALACYREDKALALRCLAELESWIDGNPPHRGVNWASGIELGLRVVSILAITTLVGEHLTGTQRTKIWGTLEAHALWLARYPSKYSSANNHLTAEGLGLFVIGALCPQFPQAPRWRDAGWAMLCETARLQILPDGVGAEQTITYTAVVLEMLLLGLQLAKVTGIEIPGYYPARVALGGEYLRWFTDEGGNQPRIGDDDNARVLGVYRRDEHYARSVLGCIAAVTCRADLTPPCFEPQLRNAVFGLPPAAAPSPTGLRVFADGGYTVCRTEAGHKVALLAIDHGYLGYLSIAAHGHADALALSLHLGDQPVLVDAGTYLYHSGGAWRRHFRGTAAHNTLCLEDTDSSTMAGNFNWSHKAKARLIDHGQQGDGWHLEAEHDGYAQRFGAIHRRHVAINSTGFSVQDNLSGNRPYNVAISWLLHPALTAVATTDGIVISKDDAALLLLKPQGPLIPSIGQPATPEGGWYSPTFGEKIATTRIVLQGSLAPEQASICSFLWKLRSE